MAEWRMPQVVRQTDRFDQVAINMKILPQRPALGFEEMADGAPDLRDLDRMRQPRAVKVVLTREKDLRLRLQLAERMRVDDAIPIDLKGVAIIGLPRGAKGLAVESIVE